MSNRKMNLDRPTLNSEQIEARQNFDQVLSKHYLIKPPVWKSPWFWGPTGLASIGIALFLSVSYINSQNNNTNDKTTTLAVKDLPKDTECIHAPVAGEDVPFQQFQVSAGKDEEIILPSGTKIEIPAGSLQPGDPSQKVQIEVREFPDKVSAFIAGIPMDYEQESAFESAGMIEIRGKQGDEIVQINPAEPIEVDLKLTKDPSGFDFWRLDENQNAWGKHPAKYESEAVVSSEKPLDKAEIKQEIVRIEEKITACDQKKETVKKPDVVDFKLPQDNHQKFDLDFNKKTYPELAKFENLVFEIIPTSGYDKNFTKKTWAEVKLEKVKDNYEMVFIAPNDKMKVAVRPVLQGKELKAAQSEFDEAMNDFDAKIKQIEAEKTELQKEKEKNRKALLSQLDVAAAQAENAASFDVNAWGVYNCDKPNRYPSAMKETLFTWENSTSPAEFETVFVFNLDKDMRFSYGNRAFHSLNDFGLHSNDNVVVFGIEKGGEFGYCELKSAKSKNEPVKIVFSKQEEAASVQDLLKKLINETVSV